MFRYKLNITPDSDFNKELAFFAEKAQASALEPDDQKFLISQIQNALLQYQKHLKVSGSHFSMNRTFESSGYKVTLKINQTSLADKILKLFGR